MDGPQVYRGAYAIMPCGHCKKSLEGGPMHLAKWAWCALCQKPVHDKYPCNEKCPRHHSGWETWDLHRYRDRVSEYIKDDVTKRWKPGDDA